MGRETLAGKLASRILLLLLDHSQVIEAPTLD